MMAVLAATVLMAAWEVSWRGHWQYPGDFKNTDDLWAQERRKATGDATVIIGSSRIFFDIDLDIWEDITGVRPVQLAFEGTSPQPMLADLAADEDFKGLVIVGVTNGLTFSGYALRGDAVEHARTQSISRRIGHRLWMVFDTLFAATDDATRPKTIIYHAEFPLREGMERRMEPRKLMVMDADRNTRVAPRVMEDEAFQQLARDIWADGLSRKLAAMKEAPDPDAMAKLQENMDRIIADFSEKAAKIRARGGEVVFAQMPYNGMYAELEDAAFPRERAFDRLVAETGSVSVTFHDYPELQGLHLPEWSHLAPRDAEVFTARFAPILDARLEESKAIKAD